MGKELKNLDEFLNNEDQEKNIKGEKESNEKVVIQPKTGLVERVDRKLIIEDGRELLRERLY